MRVWERKRASVPSINKLPNDNKHSHQHIVIEMIKTIGTRRALRVLLLLGVTRNNIFNFGQLNISREPGFFAISHFPSNLDSKHVRLVIPSLLRAIESSSAQGRKCWNGVFIQGRTRSFISKCFLKPVSCGVHQFSTTRTFCTYSLSLTSVFLDYRFELFYILY